MGLSQGLGMALGGRFGKLDFRSYVVLGDGDMQEGNTWEAIMAGGHHCVSSLCAILDANGLQADGQVVDIMDYGPLFEKIEAFRWQVCDIDGHDAGAIALALDKARACSDRPTFIVARTVKGKGVSFMENQPQWHGTVQITDDDLERALGEIAA
jgi:transketolase